MYRKKKKKEEKERKTPNYYCKAEDTHTYRTHTHNTHTQESQLIHCDYKVQAEAKIQKMCPKVKYSNKTRRNSLSI